MTKVTVIIPIYNTKEFLSECLDSVIQQTYNNLEIILVNDGSNDGSVEIIDEYSRKDYRIKAIHLNERKGVGYARNVGLKEATGDYIYFLDSDDFISENNIELLINLIGDEDFLAGKFVEVKKSRESALKDNEGAPVAIKNGKLNSFSSILNVLIKKDFLVKNKIMFSEDVKVYTDLSFIMQMLEKNRNYQIVEGCHYYLRVRNDPISNPSLSQLDSTIRLESFLNVYISLKKKYQAEKWISQILDHHFINIYKRNIPTLLKDEKEIHQIKTLILEAGKWLLKESAKNTSFIIRWELLALKKGNWKKLIKRMQTHQFLGKLKYSLTGKTKFYLFLYHQVFMKLPLKEDTIVFESFLGKNYSDSPKYIYEQLLKENRNYKYVWIFNNPGKKIPGNAKQVKRFSFKYYYYMARAKYWVSNSRLPKSLTKREGNIYLQTWHGTPLKKLVFDMKDIYSANPKYKADFYKQSRRWDYLISANQYSSDIFRRAFKFEKEMIEVGYPRNDILYAKDKERIANQIKRNLNIPLDKKVILYAPTWRDDDFYAPGKYKFQLKLNLKQMKEKLGDQYVVLLRMHYFIADHIDTDGAEGFAYNLSHYDDIAELYLISDLLITDYSSVFFDYANLKRPILFYTYDLEKYRDQLRGFYIDMEKDIPGPLLKTTEEIIAAVQNIEVVQEEYRERYEQFHHRFCAWENGDAAEKVCKIVFK